MTHDDDIDLSRAPVLNHLLELRRRLIYCMLFFFGVFGVCYFFVEDIYRFLLQPLYLAFDAPEQRRLIYTGLQEAFFTYMKLAFSAALFLSLPIILLQVWRFLAPGLYRHERRSALPLIMMTPVLFYLGGCLAFFGVIPLAWDFFLSFESPGSTAGLAVQLEARISEYLNLVIKLILAFSVCFELPVVLVLLAKIGMVTAADLAKYRRHAIVFVFAAAALLTPPDLISQIALGLPVLALHEATIIFIRATSADATGRKRAETLAQNMR